MATWKKVIVSGSDASLNSLIVSAGPLQVTGSTNLSGSVQGLGTVELSGSVQLKGEVSLTGQLIVTGSASGSFSGSFAGDGSQLTGVIAQNANSLSNSTGISSFNYNGSSPQSVSVSGAVSLSTNAVTKWSGAAFVNSSITDGGNVTINNGGGVYIQGGGLDVSGSSVFHDNLTVQGNLTVNGTASFQNTTNLEVADQFILLNSGSSTFQDSGIVINTGNSGNSGSAWYLETSGTTTGAPQNGRFAVASNIAPNATTATPDEYAVTAVISGSAPGASVPQWGGSGLGQGNMWVDSSTSDIWIYA
jgi:cytoskeletal protein CcmA (bactofilin family)